jgi:adenylate cyclase
LRAVIEGLGSQQLQLHPRSGLDILVAPIKFNLRGKRVTDTGAAAEANEAPGTEESSASLMRRIEDLESKLRFLMEATKALASTLDLGELLGRILDVAKSQAGAERGTLFLVDEKREEIWSLIAHGIEKREIRLPLGRGIAGHVAKSGEILNIPDAYSDPRFDRDVDARTGYRTRNLLCLPIRNKHDKIIAALQLLNKQSGPFTAEDIDFLLAISDHVALALENAQLHRALLEKERLEREMALARDIQVRWFIECPKGINIISRR